MRIRARRSTSSAATAALAAAYGASPAAGRVPEIDAVDTIAPPPPASMIGATALHPVEHRREVQRDDPLPLVDRILVQRAQVAAARVVEQQRDAAEAVGGVLDGGVERVEVGDVDRVRQRRRSRPRRLRRVRPTTSNTATCAPCSANRRHVAAPIPSRRPSRSLAARPAVAHRAVPCGDANPSRYPAPAQWGRLAQLVRALARHARGRGFESLTAHFVMSRDIEDSVNPSRVVVTGARAWHGSRIEFGWKDAGVRVQHARLTPVTCRLMEPTTGAHVLDIGCGNGVMADRYRSWGCAVTGTEISAEGLADARSTYPEVEFAEASVYDDVRHLAHLGLRCRRLDRGDRTPGSRPNECWQRAVRRGATRRYGDHHHALPRVREEPRVCRSSTVGTVTGTSLARAGTSSSSRGARSRQ